MRKIENEWYFDTVYNEEEELTKDTEPNYMALLYAIKHNATPDKALKMMGLVKTDSICESEIMKSSYVRKGREHKGLNRG